MSGAEDPPTPTLRSPQGARWRASLGLHRLHTYVHSLRGLAALRAWVRGGEVGIVLLALLAGATSGLVAAAMGRAAREIHVVLFGPEAERGLSALHSAAPALLLLVPAAGGLLLGLLNILIARWRPQSPVDPIEANALHGGRASMADGAVVGAQNLVSNGFGASVGLEAAYAQAGAGLASRLGQSFGLRRGDLRVLVGCGAAGAIAAAFGAPITGAFYAFELVIGTYAISGLAPVMAAAVAGTLSIRLLGEEHAVTVPVGIATPLASDYGLALLLGLACGLVAIALMRGMSFIEVALRRGVPWASLRPAAGGLAVGALALADTNVLGAGHETLHFVLVTEGAVRWLAILLVLKTVASAISIGSGFRGGLFFASLLLGAVLGKLFGFGAALVMERGVDDALFAIVGMSAFGAAVIGAPLAMAFLALETTRDFAVAGPVLAAVAVAGLSVRRLFGYSFATWRFHLRGEAIRGPQDVGWLRDLTVGKLMRRDPRTVRADMRLPAFRRAVPLGAEHRVIAVDEAGRYAGMVLVAEAHAPEATAETLAELLRLRDRALLPAMNAKQALSIFEAAEAEALVVVDGPETRRVIGLLTEAHLLRRYGEEIDKRRREEIGLPGVMAGSPARPGG